MHALKLLATAAIFSAVTAAAALAGSQYEAGVYLYDEGEGLYYADGAISAVHYSSDNLQVMECRVDASLWWLGGSCYARNSAGQSRACSTTNAELVRTIGTINASSWVRFSTDDFGVCRNITVNNSSVHL